jgi:diguanylate cyclase (GGDEF)-like protein/PAS domain S-box-containing protein
MKSERPALLLPDHHNFKHLVDHLFDGVYCVDRSRRITYWNRGAEQITGYSSGEVLGSSCQDNLLIHIDSEGRSLCDTERCPALKVMQNGAENDAEVFVHHKDGHRIPITTRIVPMTDDRGAVVGAMEVFRDASALTSLRQEFKDLEQLALVDPLTEIGNRRYLELHLRARMDEMQRYGWRFGLLFCDIDRFKRVNDTFGHQVGDDVIRMVAKTLAACIRPFDFVGRWGGEEFMAIITRVRPWQLYAIAERLRALVQESLITADDQQIRATISIGATIATLEDSQRGLFDRVDRLLYQSKADGMNRVTMDAE